MIAPGFLGQFHGNSCYLDLRTRAAFRDAFDRMPIAIAAGETHQAIDIGRIRTQHPVNMALFFNKLLPVEGPQGAQAGDTVAHRDLIGGLRLAVQMDDAFHGLPVFNQPLVQPADSDGDLPDASLQPLSVFGDKAVAESRFTFDELRENHDHLFRIAIKRG